MPEKKVTIAGLNCDTPSPDMIHSKEIEMRRVTAVLKRRAPIRDNIQAPAASTETGRFISRNSKAISSKGIDRSNVGVN
jgi:hypothetical protein